MTATRRAGVTWLLAVIVFAASFAYRFLSTTGLHNDHYMHLAWARQVMAGEWPIRDFVDPGMPLTYYTSAAAELVLGRTVLAEVLLCITALAFGAAVSFLLALRASGSRALGLAAAAMQVLLAARLYSYPKIVLHLVAAWLFWSYAVSPTRVRLLVIAAWTVVAFLFRHDHGVYVGAATLALVAAVHLPRRVPAFRRHVLAYTGTVVLALSPFLVFVQVHGGLITYFRSGLDFTSVEKVKTGLRDWPTFDLSTPAPVAPVITVRWAPEVNEIVRGRLEVEHGLDALARVAGPTWRYTLRDPREANVRALLARPEVEDTAGIDRTTANLQPQNQTLATWLSQQARALGLSPVAGLFRPGNAAAWLYYLFLGLPVVTLGVLIWQRAAAASSPVAGEAGFALIASVAVLCGLTNYGFLRDPLPARLPDASALTGVLGAWLLARTRSRSRGVAPGASVPQRRVVKDVARGVLGWTLITSLAGCTLVSAAEVGGAWRQLDETRLPGGPRAALRRGVELWRELGAKPAIDGWVASGDDRRTLKQFSRYVYECTAPSDALLVAAFEPEVNFYAERKFAAGLAFFSPGFFVAPRDQELAIERLRRQAAPVALIEVSGEPPLFERTYPRIASYMSGRYRIAGELAGEDGRVYRILVDASAPVTRSYEPLALPCWR